jgi:transposase InsO family protein
MPWKESTPMSQRQEFVLIAHTRSIKFSQLCQRYGISRKTGYKWLKRHQDQGLTGLENQSRRPVNSPSKTSAEVEQKVVELRYKNRAWGGRTIRARLEASGETELPAPSTITEILHRHHLILPEESQARARFQRFEHPAPNDLWQMDFKGDFPTAERRCYPLTVLDDHSRFAICLQASANQKTETVKQALTTVFRRYGLPWRMTMDNGAPWGAPGAPRGTWTQLTVWLVQLGIRISHSRPYHPQTQGKNERFHRTLKTELLRDYAWRDLSECQMRFDAWRDLYNCERPHQALQMAVPASRYEASKRPFPEQLPPPEYPAGDLIRRVQSNGMIYYHQRTYFVGEAFRGLDLALRLTTSENIFEVWFCHQKIKTLDLNLRVDIADR